MFRFRSADARRRAVQVLSITLSATIAVMPAAPLAAGPRNANVVRGQASVQQDGARTTIHAGRDAIIEYEQFNVGANESVRFVQPDARARVLNRVVGGEVSRIAGELRANGIVYLTNPQGIVFTPGARVNVSGLYAAAGTLRDSDFVTGTDLFRNLQGEVVNHGTLSGDAIHLLGQRVANHGTITADARDGGIVTMAAGDRVLLRQTGGRIYVEIDNQRITDRDKPAAGQTTPDLNSEAGVENTGTVNAPQGQITLGAGDMYSLAVRNQGDVNAAGGNVKVSATDGAVHNEGSLSASATGSDSAGQVNVQAPAVVNEGAITADAHTGKAGSINFTSNAHTYLLTGSRLSATGGAGYADGGNVLVHSYHGRTVFADGAIIDVRSGARGGAGGFAEVSGQSLAFHGSVNLAGEAGFGHLLIDPRDLTINDVGGDDALLDGNTVAFDEPDRNTDAFISDEALEALVGDITLQADRDLFVQHPVDLTNLNSVTLQANRHIEINQPINGAMNFIATADADSNGAGTLTIASRLNNILGSAQFNGAQIAVQTDSISPRLFQIYNGPVTLNQDITLGGTGARFNSTVDAANGAPVNLNVAGSALFAGNVGQVRPLATIDVDGAVNFDTPHITTSGAQHYNDAATALSDTTLHTTRATFADSVDAGSPGSASLAVDGNTTFEGAVGNARPLKSLNVTGTTQINGGLVDTTGRQVYEQAVTLGNDALLTGGALIALEQTTDGQHALTIRSADGDIRFGDDVGAQTPLASLEMHADGLIVVRGELIHALGDILANPNGRADIPATATVAAPDGGLIVRSSTGSFVMGPHEKLTVLGRLNIDVADTATLGDVNSLGDMIVRADTIELRRRAAANVLESDGERRSDSGADYITGGEFAFSVAPTFVGSGGTPVFASPSLTPDRNGTLLDVQRNVALTRGDFFFGNTVLDLRPIQPDADPELAETFAEQGDIPFTDLVLEEVLLAPGAQQAMNQLALNVQPIGAPALRERLAGRHMIDDTGAGITVYRIRALNARQALDVYFSLFVQRVEDEQTGEMRIASRTNELRQSLAGAWRDYTEQVAQTQQRETEEEPTPTGFRQYLATQPGRGTAGPDLLGIRRMLHHLRQSGLSAVEYQRTRDMLLERIKPTALTLEQMRTIFDPSHVDTSA